MYIDVTAIHLSFFIAYFLYFVRQKLNKMKTLFYAKLSYNILFFIRDYDESDESSENESDDETTKKKVCKIFFIIDYY